MDRPLFVKKSIYKKQKTERTQGRQASQGSVNTFSKYQRKQPAYKKKSNISPSNPQEGNAAVLPPKEIEAIKHEIMRLVRDGRSVEVKKAIRLGEVHPQIVQFLISHLTTHKNANIAADILRDHGLDFDDFPQLVSILRNKSVWWLVKACSKDEVELRLRKDRMMLAEAATIYYKRRKF